MLWTRFQRDLGDTRFREGPHVILASQDTGDIAALMALGAKPSSIIAVDKDPEACLAVLEQFPGVKVINDDIFEVTKMYERKLASIFFDFCSTASLEVIEKISHVLSRVPNNTSWAVTFAYGRESEQRMRDYETMCDRLLKELGEEDNESNKYRRHVLGHDPTVVTQLMKYLDEKTVENGEDAFGWRCIVLTQYLTMRCSTLLVEQPKKGCCALELVVQYLSETEFKKGMPMMLFAGTVLRQQQGESVRMAFQRILDTIPELGVKPLRLKSFSEMDFRLWVVDFYDDFRKIMGHQQVAQLLNIPVELLNTWVGEQP